MVRVRVIEAWPGRFDEVELDLPAGSTAETARQTSGLGAEIAGMAVFGVKVPPDHVLSDGDRLELLRPLTLDPKVARRKRAEARPVKLKKK